jgi:hypothetical protein
MVISHVILVRAPVFEILNFPLLDPQELFFPLIIILRCNYTGFDKLQKN